ncbi:carbohydrate binding family 9 domain-containing protein [bacterium]|nr:carbohydrate binding family 9 domain-containing protein [bacterium]
MKHPTIFMSCLILCLFVLYSSRFDLSAQVQNELVLDTAPPSEKIEIFVNWTDKEIKVDGVLDEEAWNDAEPYEDYFYQLEPLDRAPSSEKTKVMVLQDDHMIYFGILCYDSEPDKIFASSMRRDAIFRRGELIELLIDTFRDNRNCYLFQANPLGGKGDCIISDRGSHVNSSWETVVYIDGEVNDQGWVAEFGIPFKSLKYKEGEWGINITREIMHRQEETYLVPLPRALGHNVKFRGDYFAVLRNIRPPKQGFNFEVYPYVLAGQTNVYLPNSDRKREFDAGVDFKYDITTQLALDLTYRTDFAQAEADEEIVNVTRFNVRTREKREFFLQNAGFFDFGGSAFMPFDSRTIGIQNRQRIPLIGGVKLTGRAGPYSIGLLSLQSEKTDLDDGGQLPSTNYSVFRLKRDVGSNSSIGLMAVNKQESSDTYGRTFGLDGIWNISQEIQLDGSVAKTFSPDINDKDAAFDVGFTLNKSWIDVGLGYTHIDSLFRPEMGFVRRRNIRTADGDVTFTQWINKGQFRSIAFSTGLSYITDLHQVLQTRDNSFSFSLTFRSGDELRLGTTRSYECVPEPDRIRNITIDPDIYTTWGQSIRLSTYRARPINGNVSFSWGQLFDGNQQSFDISGAAKLSNNLNVDLSYGYDHLSLKNGEFSSHLMSTRWTYSFSPDLFAKAYIQYNKADNRFSANFIIDYGYRPRSHIYLVYNENRDTDLNQPIDRIIMLKMTYLWQI